VKLSHPLLTLSVAVLVTVTQISFGADDDLVSGESRQEALARAAAEEANTPAMSLFDRRGIPSFLNDELRYMVDRFRGSYNLSDAQQVRLKFAGRNDVQRVANQLKDQHNANAVVDERQQMFGRGSFTEKVIPRIFTRDQLSRYHTDLDERSRLQFRSDIESTIRDLERHVVLQIEQQETLVDLMICELPPLTIEGKSGVSIIRFRLSQLPEAALKPVFTDRQWNRVKPALDDYRRQGTVNGIAHLVAEKEKHDLETDGQTSEDRPASTTPSPPAPREVTQ